MNQEINLLFLLTNVLLGAGLAMDAFSVSLANGLNEPGMRKHKFFGIAGTFAFFQFAMPMIGWICIHTILGYFQAFQKYIPWIALALLSYIGIKMILDGRKEEESGKAGKLKPPELILQGIATSIDALSVGFTIAEYSAMAAFTASVIIAAVTFAICVGGLYIGRRFGTKISGKASILGGCILIGIGLEIFLTGIF